MGAEFYLHIILENDSELATAIKLVDGILQKYAMDKEPWYNKGSFRYGIKYPTYPKPMKIVGAGESAAFPVVMEFAKSGECMKEPVIVIHEIINTRGEDHEVLNGITKEILEMLDPICAYGGNGGYDFSVEQHYIEYQRDPYNFCIDPRINKWKPRHYTRSWLCGRHHPFLFDPKIQNEKEEYERLISRRELITLIKKHSKGIIIGKRGIGKLDGLPRYWIRKKLRELGASVPIETPEYNAYLNKEDFEFTKKLDFTSYLKERGIKKFEWD